MAWKKNELDDDYWESSAHKSFDFGDLDKQTSVGDSKLSVLMRKVELNQFDLVKCDGLAEVAENSSPKEFIPFHISKENEKYASKLAKSFNPLIINQKRRAQNKSCGPEETIKNMISGLEYSLTRFKGKREKIALLDAAVKSHDGNTILEVVLFLRETLKKSIFQREIVNYPDAVNVYLSYLEEDHESDELANMLLLLNKAEEAGILKYEAAVISQHTERKLRLIDNCLRTHFQHDVTDSFLRQSLEEHKQMLKEQVILENNNLIPMNETEHMETFEKLTGKKSVIDSSVLCSLIFCCLCCYISGMSREVLLKHFSFACPEQIKSSYNLSKKQYTWAVLRALVATKRWSDVDDLFVTKNWLGGTKMRSCITYSRILEILSKAKAPNETLKTYVSCVENEYEKLRLAKKYSCHSIVIEVLKNNKDRIGLKEYMASLPRDEPISNLIIDVLKNPMIRWKN